MITSENNSVARESSRVIILKSCLKSTANSACTSEVRDNFDRHIYVPTDWWQLMCSCVLQPWGCCNSTTAPVRNITLNSLSIFKDGPEYLTRGTIQVFFSLWWDSCCGAWFWIFFPLRYPFLTFYLISACLMMSTFNIPQYSNFILPQPLWFFLYLAGLFLLLFCLFLLFIMNMANISMPNSILTYWLCLYQSQILFSFLANSLMFSLYISG